MSKIEHRNLLRFLSKPRFVHEVAEHYGISKKLANFHLREAVKSGDVLISERPIFRTFRSPDGKLRRLGGFVYVFRSSPVFGGGWEKFALKEMVDSASRPAVSLASVGFLSKTNSLPRKDVFNVKLSSFAFNKPADSLAAVSHYRTGRILASEFDVSSSKVKLAKRKTVDQLLRRGTASTQEEATSLSHAERIRLLKAVLKEPLPFLDLHGRFRVSRQTVAGLVKNGLLMEVWGPKAIGVRFKLTRKGRIQLRELEAAAKYKPTVRETSFIRLKQRTAV